METTLPWSWYVDPEILRREQERIFRTAWQYAGHLRQLPEPGTFFTGRAGRLPVVVTRARDGELRAFLNVCRHRGFPVADGEGRRETLQCPYHAWTYGLDGSLRAAPRSDEEPDFRKEELGLCAVAVGTWGPFVFVNAGPDPEPLADALGSMPAQVAELGLDVDALRHHVRWEAEVAANWKIVCENFLECYHCQVAHPRLLRGDRRVGRGVRARCERAAVEPVRADPRERPAARWTSRASCRAASSTSSGRT